MGMAMPMLNTSANLNGTVKGATTLVAIMVAPAGNFAMSGFATKLKIWFM